MRIFVCADLSNFHSLDSRMGGFDGFGYGSYTYDKLERELYLPSEKLRISITCVGDSSPLTL